MLILTRGVDQEVVIGLEGKLLGIVKVVDIMGERIRIGLDFPKSVDVHRAEIWNKRFPDQRVTLATDREGDGR